MALLILNSNIYKRIWSVVKSSSDWATFLALIITATITLWKKSETSGIVSVIALSSCLLASIGYNLFIQNKTAKANALLLAQISSLGVKIASLEKKDLHNNNDYEIEISNLNKTLRYNCMFKHLNRAFAEIRKHEREEIKIHNKNKFIYSLKEFCNTINSAFHEVTSKEYHVCIKIIVNNRCADEVSSFNKLKNFPVRTLVRDGTLLSERSEMDSTQILEVIKKNTDYTTTVDNWLLNQSPFFCNNLIQLKGYTNTRFIDHFGNHKNDFDNATIEEKEKNWPLIYKSGIVSAIGSVSKSQNNKKKVGSIIGFFCIDSKEASVFDEKIDPIIVAGCADALFNPLLNFMQTYKTDLID